MDVGRASMPLSPPASWWAGLALSLVALVGAAASRISSAASASALSSSCSIRILSILLCLDLSYLSMARTSKSISSPEPTSEEYSRSSLDSLSDSPPPSDVSRSSAAMPLVPEPSSASIIAPQWIAAS